MRGSLQSIYTISGATKSTAHPCVLHSSQVDVRDMRIEGQRIAIIGGGMTAASLALAAAAAGAAAVHLIHRR